MVGHGKVFSMEIERKFLVKRLPPRWKATPHSRIRQGYFPLARTGIEIRVRQKGSLYFITIKAGHGAERLEEEMEISKRRFTALWPLVCAASICKTRYRIAYGKHAIEMDAYEGPHRGLITADVEFRSKREAVSFRPPEWCGREITGVRRYANEVLARRGHL
jgi:CYTH domain-containing protein